MTPTTTQPCEYCRVQVPRFALTPGEFESVVRALRNGSKTLAAAEVKHFVDCDDVEARSWLAHLLSCVFSWPVAQADQAVLGQIDRAFEGVQKPEHFTNYAHCAECAEHDSTLRNRTRETLRREDLGNPAWDPLTFSSEQGIAYVFPAAARYALLPDAWRDRDWYGCQLLSHLSYEGRDKSFREWCSARQRAAVWALLEHLAATRMRAFEDVGCREELLAALSSWKSGQLDR